MSKRNDKNIDIPKGVDSQRPVMRTSKRKLGRGLGDLMGTPTSVETGRIKNSTPTLTNDLGQVAAEETAKIQTVSQDDMPSQDMSGFDTQVTVPNQVDTDIASNTDVNSQQIFEEEPLGMDAESIESVMTGTPKSRSAVAPRDERKKKRRRHNALVATIVIVAILLVGGLITGGIMLYTSDYFKIENIEINGALHLTDDEVLQLANVDSEDTLLRVDTDTIITRLKRDAWVKDVAIEKRFPDTLVINITERAITAIVEVPTTKDSGSSVSTSSSATSKSTTVRMWAISADRIWLMPIPDQNSEVGKSLNQQIYADLAGIMHIVDVLPSVNPEIGCYCTDPTLQCAIDVVASMTTELKSQVKYVKASDSQSTTLILNNGVEVAVGTNEDMRDKERIVLELLEKHEGKISFINVRNVNNPTWRTL